MSLLENNELQFARLLCELVAAGVPSKEIVQDLCVSMDLTPAEITNIFDRAHFVFEAAKSAPVPHEEVTVAVNLYDPSRLDVSIDPSFRKLTDLPVEAQELVEQEVRKSISAFEGTQITGTVRRQISAAATEAIQRALEETCPSTPPRFPVIAEVWSDDRNIEYEVEVSSFLVGQSDEYILAVWYDQSCNAETDRFHFDVGSSYEEGRRLEGYLAAIADDPMKKDVCGYGCGIKDDAQFMAWIREYRPELAKEIEED